MVAYICMIADADCLALLLSGLLRLMRRFEHLKSLSGQRMELLKFEASPLWDLVIFYEGRSPIKREWIVKVRRISGGMR